MTTDKAKAIAAKLSDAQRRGLVALARWGKAHGPGKLMPTSRRCTAATARGLERHRLADMVLDGVGGWGLQLTDLGRAVSDWIGVADSTHMDRLVVYRCSRCSRVVGYPRATFDGLPRCPGCDKDPTTLAVILGGVD